MKVLLKPVSSLALILIPMIAFSQHGTQKKAASEIIKTVVLESYINGAFNKLDTDAMQKGFHEDFAMMWVEKDSLARYPISSWVPRVNQRKSDNYDPNDARNVWEPTFVNIDITEGAATVKIELRNQGKLVYTDYLTLLKFESGWRIVSKVFHHHKQS